MKYRYFNVYDTDSLHVNEVSMLLKHLYPIKVQETNKCVI